MYSRGTQERIGAAELERVRDEMRASILRVHELLVMTQGLLLAVTSRVDPASVEASTPAGSASKRVAV